MGMPQPLFTTSVHCTVFRIFRTAPMVTQSSANLPTYPARGKECSLPISCCRCLGPTLGASWNAQPETLQHLQGSNISVRWGPVHIQTIQDEEPPQTDETTRLYPSVFKNTTAICAASKLEGPLHVIKGPATKECPSVGHEIFNGSETKDPSKHLNRSSRCGLKRSAKTGTKFLFLVFVVFGG